MSKRIKVTRRQLRDLKEQVETYCPPCEWEPCGEPITPDDDWVIDHRVPWHALDALKHRLVGEHWPYLLADDVNLQPMHRQCNIDKGHTIVHADVRALEELWDDDLRCFLRGEPPSDTFHRVRRSIIAETRRQRERANRELQLMLEL